MRNQAINATFECYKKRSKSFDDKTKSSCVKGGEEGWIFSKKMSYMEIIYAQCQEQFLY